MKTKRVKKTIVVVFDELNTNLFVQNRSGINHIDSIKSLDIKHDLYGLLRKLGFKITLIDNRKKEEK